MSLSHRHICIVSTDDFTCHICFRSKDKRHVLCAAGTSLYTPMYTQVRVENERKNRVPDSSEDTDYSADLEDAAARLFKTQQAKWRPY